MCPFKHKRSILSKVRCHTTVRCSPPLNHHPLHPQVRVIAARAVVGDPNAEIPPTIASLQSETGDNCLAHEQRLHLGILSRIARAGTGVRVPLSPRAARCLPEAGKRRHSVLSRCKSIHKSCPHLQCVDANIGPQQVYRWHSCNSWRRLAAWRG